MISIGKNTAKTIYESLNPIILFSRLAAVCTVTKENIEGKFVRSTYMIAIQAIVLVISVLHLIFIPYAVIYIEKMPQISLGLNETITNSSLSSQKFITKMANIVLISITAILVRFWNLLRIHNILPDFLENLDMFDHVLRPRNNKDFVRTLSLSVVLLLVSWPYQVYSILIVTTDNWMAFLMFYLNLYNNFSIISCEFQFVSLCWVIQTRFEAINRRLNELSSKVMTADEEAMTNKLVHLKKCNKLLIKSCDRLNDLYGFKLLIILSGLSLNVLFGLYFSIYGGFSKNSTKTSLNFQRISNIANEVIWSFYYMARFIFVCVVAGSLTETANTPRKIICNLFKNSLNENVKQELWIYLSLTSTYKIHVSAWGFFKINRRLITSAVSMGTTYLVILAQFQKK